MQDTIVWVLAPADDGGLTPLAPAPDGVTFIRGETPGDFSGAPAPDALFACSGRALLEPVLAMAPCVRWIHSRLAGLDTLLFPALVESPVPLTNARGAYSRSLAEFSLAGLLYFARDLPRLVRNQAARRWEPFDVEELAGRTLAVVGYGDIGRAIAERARAFGMEIVAVRRRPSDPDGIARRILGLGGTRDAIAEADDVAIALPLTKDTLRVVGEAEIAALKPTGVLVNVGRGAVVDERALVRALEERRLKGAALDVFENEPLPQDHPFWTLPNVLVSPHSADHTPTWLLDSTRIFLDNLARFRRGEPLLNLVDKRAGY